MGDASNNTVHVTQAAENAWLRRARSYARLGPWNGLVALANRVLMRDLKRRLPGHGRVVGMRAKGAGKPLSVRLGTSDLWVFQEIFLDGEYEAVRGLGLGEVRTVVDLGANIGLSVRYWRMAFPSARIVAVEPDPENMSVCARNARAAGGPETVLVQSCVAGSSRKVTLDRSAPAWGYRIESAESGSAGRVIEGLGGELPKSEDLMALTMPEVLARGGIEGEVDLLKCDIEGAEAEVFANCRPWIGRVRALVVELHGGYTREKFEADLDANGYRGRVTSLKRVDDVHVLLVERDGAGG